MRTRLVSFALSLLLVAAAIPAIAHHTSADSGAPVTVGKAADSKWTETTIKAAATDANKKVLASGKPAAVTGEVVEVSCYLQLGKRGEAHIPCGTKCINNGQPIGLVDAQNNLYLLFAEEHDPRRDGQVTLKDAFLPLLAKQVTVNGMMTQMKGGIRALYVPAATLSDIKTQ
ncbi:MAG TPA: hypothetical protein VMJ70_05775, partial [Candidatus Sulfotelmatobacter sp.]|nr:hypothetical protein [Candidatus Sulfotelmatobacter sp.]